MRQAGWVHVYIDDSGDGGYKFGRGSTSHLVMAACVFRHPGDIRHVVQLIDGCASNRRMTKEFKYSERSEQTRDLFFEVIAPAKFHVRTIIIDKSTIYSEKLRESPQALKSFAIRMLLTKNYGQIRGAKVFIDGDDTKAFGVGDGDYLIRMVNGESPGTISEVRHMNSLASRPIQLADMVAGAVLRAVRTDQPNSSAHLETFKRRLFQPEGSYWFFKTSRQIFDP